MVAFSGFLHGLIGLCLGFWVPDMSIFWVWLGSMWPDCDIRSAFMGKFFPLWLFGVKHRSPVTHSLYALILWSLPVALFFGHHAAYSFGTGYLSHLLCDSLTPMGVRWLGKKKPRRQRSTVEWGKGDCPHCSTKRHRV